MKRCSSKQVDIVSLGALRLDPGWHNAGYIFPDGFTTSTVFRSSVRPPALLHAVCGACSLGTLGFRIVHAGMQPSSSLPWYLQGPLASSASSLHHLTIVDDQRCQGPCVQLRTPGLACS